MTRQIPMFSTEGQASASGLTAPARADIPASSVEGATAPADGRSGLAARDPVARVVVLVEPPHLDREFDYLVPAALDEAAAPGTRVRVRLAGRLVDGFVVSRTALTEHASVPLRSVHGPPVLTATVARLCRAVADRYAGTMADVLRSAVPPRHARAERAATSRADPPRGGLSAPLASHGREPPSVQGEPLAGPDERERDDLPVGAQWRRYAGGDTLLQGVARGEAPRALWVPLPGEAVAERFADLVALAASRGSGSIVVVPDGSDLHRFAAAVTDRGVPLVRLSAAAGPESRYRAFLRVLTGERRVVLGTRSAVFAPVRDLGLLLVWDDLDESMQEGHAPGWHAREVAALRSVQEGLALVVAGPGVSMESARMADAGWLQVVAAPRSAVRAAMPRTRTVADEPGAPAQGRIPGPVITLAKEALSQGPVLVVVPRAGYLPLLACSDCREVAGCPTCGRPLQLAAGGLRSGALPACAEHGKRSWTCPHCQGSSLRAAVVGIGRTAEELGRAMPGVEVISSTGDHIVRALHGRLGSADDRDDGGPALVVATPGAVPEPGAAGYAAAIILDGSVSLSRPGQRVGEQVVRAWFEASGRVRGGPAGGQVLIAGDPGAREVAALVRWDPLGYAVRELGERRELRLAPAVRVVSLEGQALPAGELATEVRAELGERIVRAVGPVQRGEETLWLLCVGFADGPALAASVRRHQGLRSARRAPVVRSRIDPPA